MRLHGLGEPAVEVVPHQPYELGPFVVIFVPSRHSKLLREVSAVAGDAQVPALPRIDA